MVEKKFANTTDAKQRIHHWNLAQGSDSHLILSLAWVVFGIYALALFKIDWLVNWLEDVDGNFLLFVITPLVIVSIRHYKTLIFWGYDILRPVNKRQYFIDRIRSVVVDTFRYWTLVVIIFGVIPTLLFDFSTGITAGLIGYFALSGSLLALALGVMTVVTATEDDSLSVIMYGGMLSAIFLMFYEPSIFLTVKGYALSSAVCLIGGLFYIRQGFNAWIRKEYL